MRRFRGSTGNWYGRKGMFLGLICGMRQISIWCLMAIWWSGFSFGSSGEFFRTCEELGISGGSTLVAHCLRDDGSRVRSELDLNECYGISGLDSYDPKVFPEKG